MPSDLLASARPLLAETRPYDVIYAVDLLIEESGAPDAPFSLEELKPAVSKLLNLVYSILDSRDYDYKNPLFALHSMENRAILRALGEIKPLLASLNQEWGGAMKRPRLEAIVAALDSLSPIQIHYSRLENVLFPIFEAREVKHACLSLMWSIHGDALNALKLGSSLCAEGGEGIGALSAINQAMGKLFFAINTLVFREEKLLFPAALFHLSQAETIPLFEEAQNLGEGMLTKGEMEGLEASAQAFGQELGYVPTSQRTKGHATEADIPLVTNQALALETGSLEVKTLSKILTSLGMDISFIDHDDRVRYYSDNANRLFARSPSVIGRDVRNCHPPESVARVLRIIEAFRSGRRDREAFWFEHSEKFVYIEYIAIRGERGEYLGTLELTEELDEKRSLRGEKRLASF